MKLNFRHGVISGQSIGSTLDFIAPSATVGYVDLRVAPTPLFVTIAHGRSNYLLKFDQQVLKAWGPLSSANTHYLYIDVDQITGGVSFGFSTIEPYVGVEPPQAALGAHWFDTTETVMKVRTPDNAKWMRVARLFIGRIIGTSQVVPGPIGTSVGLGGSIDAGYIVFDSQLRPVRISDGELLTDSTPARVMTTVGSSGVLTTPLNSFIPVRAAEPIPAMSVVSLVGDSSVGLASSNPTLTNPRIPVGLIERSLGENEVGVLTQQGEITHDQWSWDEDDIGKPLYCGFAGELTTQRPASIQAYRVGFVKSAKSILFYIDAETQPQVVSQPGSIIAGQPPITATTTTNANNEIITLISMLPASDTAGGYLSSTLFTTLTALDPRLTTAETTIIDLEANKANLLHSHAIATITGLQSALDAKADATHAHAEYAPIIHSHAEYASVAHAHGIADVNGLQLALDNKAAVAHAHPITDVVGLQLQLDARAVLNHTHVVADTTGLQSLLDGKAALTHAHLISDVSNLQSALDGKASVGHTHLSSSITDLAEAIDDRVASLLQPGSNITLAYNDATNSLTISAAGGTGGITTIEGNQTFDVNLNSSYSVFTPTTLRLFGNSLSLQPRINATDVGNGVLQLEVVNTGLWVNAATWSGEGGLGSQTPAVADVQFIVFDRHRVISATSNGTSPYGAGHQVAVVRPQVLQIQETVGNIVSPVSSFPRQLTNDQTDYNTDNRLVFSNAFTVTLSGTHEEITTIDLAAQNNGAPSVAIVDHDNGFELTSAVTGIEIGGGLTVENLTQTTVLISARIPTVSFTFP